ncbi:hypothetical protein X760_05865 [Mesorhizobium sp. LSHC422A00]|uniref:tetratricopeptide repeat protein n=1 Tax=Mesorhizobium sp. LSHC422A00 TaxID=1287294 RepID=UPI0003CF7644|nr:hypothetical protein [Mesorhizobium sp. LSHC422A00]ESX62649.1 hypothetical protein X760_05865 [Mesorhizobium sp. LSHC422A00]
MNTFALSPQLSASDELKLSDSYSAGLFVEAMQLIRRYEETSSRDLLVRAREVLKRCLAVSPRDPLPSFYLGITQSALGDMDQKEAIPVFKRFIKSTVFPLRAAATYNLAAAYVETYNSTLFGEGIGLLKALLEELTTNGVPIGQSEIIRGLHERLGDRRIRVEQLYYQAQETQDYLHIHLHVWGPRWDSSSVDQIEVAGKHALEKLTKRRRLLKKHERFLGRQHAEIWAWHWNNVGTIHESLAAAARRTKNKGRAHDEAAKAEKAFNDAQDADPSFASSRPNLGRLTFEVLADFGKAIEIFKDVASGVEDTAYAHFCLGQLYTVERKKTQAMSHFRKAPNLLKTERVDSSDWKNVRSYVANHLQKWCQPEPALKLLNQLAKENPSDQGLRSQISDLQNKA